MRIVANEFQLSEWCSWNPLQIGTEAAPFQHRAVITLHGHLRSPELPVYGAKTLAVREGILDLHGMAQGIGPGETSQEARDNPPDNSLNAALPNFSCLYVFSLYPPLYLFPPSQRLGQPLRSTKTHNQGHSCKALPSHRLPNLALETVHIDCFLYSSYLTRKALSLEAKIVTSSICILKWALSNIQL